MSYFNRFSPLFSLFFLLCFHHVLASSSSPDRYFKSIPQSLRENTSEEYIEATIPLPSDYLIPSCSLPLLQHDFGNTIGLPPISVSYSPPINCSGPWSYVVLEFNASCQGEQYDRIAGIWIDGVEILRTSTAEPTESGIFWKFRKDVTRYSSLFSQSNLSVTVMLENIVNDVYTGVYHVNISILYYGEKKARLFSGASDRKFNRKLGFLPEKNAIRLYKDGKFGDKGDEFAVVVGRDFEERSKFQSEEYLKKADPVFYDLDGRTKREQKSGFLYEKPADLIIPISDDGEEGFWFRIQNESDFRWKEIQIPANTERAVLEIYVSFHGNDEFWYSNPPNSYISMNNLKTGRGNGAFRQVFVTIDELFVGSQVPFPVIFTGGINPLSWEPVVAIGAFNLPSYDIDLTPFIGLLLDGKKHSIGIGVTDSIPFWLVDANLHLWLDPDSSSVQAKSVLYKSQPLSVKRDSKFKKLDGTFKIEAERKTQFSGWVNSSLGNITTHISQKSKFKNKIKFKKDGKLKEVKQKIKVETEVRIEYETEGLLSVSKATFKQNYPLKIITLTLPGSDDNNYMLITNISHALKKKFSNGDLSSYISNSQSSGGWMVVQDHSVLSGAADTNQNISSNDEFGCYSRTVSASNGKLLEDVSTSLCALSS